MKIKRSVVYGISVIITGSILGFFVAMKILEWYAKIK